MVLLALPLSRTQFDGDFLRFRLKQHSYEQQMAGFAPLKPKTAHCFVFDEMRDTSWFLGPDPYDQMIIYVSEDLAGASKPKVERFSPESKCPPWQKVTHIRPLSGRYYLADTSF